MLNWTHSRDNFGANLLIGYCIMALSPLLVGLAIAACTKGPHDFGMYNNLETICHVWKGRDGYRRQATMNINSSKNLHGSHPWDYDGACEE